MPIDEDLSDFLDLDEHADSALIVGSSSTVLGIFSRRYVEMDEIEGVHPTFLAPTAELNAAAPSGKIRHGDILNINAVALYLVRGIEPDESNGPSGEGGMTLLALEKSP